MAIAFDRAGATSALASTFIHHAEWERAHDEIMESLGDPAGAPIILALGAPGFGKTELTRVVEAEIAAAQLATMEADPNHVPVVRIEAFAPDAGRSFGWREGFLSILDRLGESDVSLRSGDALDRAALIDRRGRSQRTRSNPQLQLDVIDGLRFHTTIALIIDEIEHIAYHQDVARFGASADILKTIANETGVRLVTAGSYEGMGFRSVSGQLLRRMRNVHLRRYRAGVPAEFAEYSRVALAMLELIGYEGDGAALVPTLYRQSLGAIGTTADLLMQAEHAWRTFGDSLIHGIGRHSRDEDALASVAADLIKAEGILDAGPLARTRLDELLGLTGATTPAVRAGKVKTSPKRRRPGRRNPSRDLVGIGLGG